MKTGEIGKKTWMHARWCEPCDQYHGVLYVCDKYPKELKEKLTVKSEEWRKNPKYQKHVSKWKGGEITQFFADLED